MAFDLIPQVIAEVRPYTMVPDDGLATTIELTDEPWVIEQAVQVAA
jgi:hypothetical protein